MTDPTGQPAYPARRDNLSEIQEGRSRRRAVLWSLVVVTIPVWVALLGLQVVLARDEGCNMTPPGYFHQTLVSQT